MNKKILLSALVIGVLYTSCSKDESSPAPTAGGGGGGGGNPTPTTTYVIAQDSTYDNANTNNTQVRIFEFNSSKKLVKVSYKWGTSTTFNQWDTVYYNAGGKVSKVERYSTGNPVANMVNNYTYVGNDLTLVNESGIDNNSNAYTRTRTFTYSAGKAISQNVVYTVGSGNNGGPENINSITYSGGNMASANIELDLGNGLQWVPITLTSSTTAANPYYGLNYSSDDFLNLFNPNNVLKAYVTAFPNDPNYLFVDNSYTYSNGRVATITDSSQGNSRITFITYQGL